MQRFGTLLAVVRAPVEEPGLPAFAARVVDIKSPGGAADRIGILAAHYDGITQVIWNIRGALPAAAVTDSMPRTKLLLFCTEPYLSCFARRKSIRRSRYFRCVSARHPAGLDRNHRRQLIDDVPVPTGLHSPLP